MDFEEEAKRVKAIQIKRNRMIQDIVNEKYVHKDKLVKWLNDSIDKIQYDIAHGLLQSKEEKYIAKGRLSIIKEIKEQMCLEKII
ncbi:TPA: hypothetical protein KNO10_002159 [Clostridioides difficile]|uniref:hypothetical protein n=1 Tax=Clostridioides difficile TaxID=1496 RepID=UPI00038D73C4|nr:hypothetical protein [Clostridioides difficile]EQG38342.1 hypothetical protein QIO_0542 [Clostridioides difficile DA00129]SJQ30642.1 Uncharacterised protein [Clostridioides difficile]SJR41710.1 Uncharacterised protein [Clostridioides difficile]HBF0262858.1 hypothetical protein [Clostridioides difficile]HBF0729007.1 hypothetical protein [Clostridioides difficile]